MRRGFTLIELMVVVAISAVVMSGGIAAYRGFADKYQIKQAGSEFQTNLKLFQRKAMSGEKPTECLGGFEGIRVRRIDASNYAFQAQCGTVDGDEQIIALPEGTIFNTANFDLFFATLNSAVTGAQTVEITATGSVNIYEVIIEANGVIKGGLQ
ncbi:MAG: prepilin-type N-terminal cleavage/methylation domain-containing protein [Patescibacteria group bacterium]